MAEVTNELLYEVLKSIQQRLTNLEHLAVEHSQSMAAFRGHLLSTQTDTNNVYAVLSRIDQRLDRVERRLELRELAEPQHPFEPHP